MKYKSKSLISIILSIMMVMSMILVAIPANAAVIDSDPVGAGTYYIWYNTKNNNAITSDGAWSSKAMNTSDNGTTYYYDITSEGENIFVNFNQSDSSATASSSIWSDSDSAYKAVTDNSTVVTSYGGQNYGSYNFLRLYAASGATFRITYNPTKKTVVLSDVSSDPTDPIVPTTTTPVSTTSWYLVGGNSDGPFGADWGATTNKNYPLNETYEGKSNVVCRTVTFTKDTYFRFSDGTNTYYGTENDQALGDSSNKISLTQYPGSGNWSFKNTVPQTIKICLDTSNKQVWYESATEPTTTEPVETTVPPTTAPVGDYTITDITEVNGSLSFSAEGRTAGRANANDTVKITANPAYSYFELDTVTVTGADKTDIKVSGSGDTRTFTMPAQNVTAKATFKLNKSAYIRSLNEDGLWIDVAPDKYDTTATLIKWNNYSGNNHGTNDYYTFYVPKNVDLANAKVYNGFDSEVKLNDVSIPANNCNTDKLSIPASDTNYTTEGATTSQVKVMQGSTNAMFLHTTDNTGADYDLPTKIDNKFPTKSTVETSGGLCTTMVINSDATSTVSSAMKLESVKGRGNSSWEASYKLFGKYAFNMKLASKTKLFGMDNSKSWCLLANNADESMMRNALTYQLAKEIGIQDSPEFRFVDIYDNGEYLGAYLITEKVDVGKSKLVKGESFEDINETAANKNVDEGTNRGQYTYNNKQYNMQYANVLPSGSNTSTIDYDKNGKYLLEFELKNRLFPPNGNESNKASEASWFRSPKGQYVVVKSPEFATKEQVEFIAGKFAEMEDKIFTSGATHAQLSTVMDVESFAKMYLIQEFSSNLDSAATSYYMTFDCAQTDPVFVANPVWDYDWAYGQYEKKGKKDVNDKLLDSANPQDWFAKSKQIGDNEAEGNNKYSIQSQLASNSDSFKSVVRKVWEQENGFYDNIKKYYGDNSQIDAWYNQIKDSVDMNETRWGFIANDPLIKGESGTGRDSWGSKNTGANHAEAVYYLENTWTKVRAEEFLNTESGLLNSEYAPYTPAKPTISAYNADLSATITSPINAGTDFVIKVTSEIESGVKYRLYEGSSSAYLYENKDGVFALKATEAGKKTYTVKAVFGEKESLASDSVEVTVVALDITDVTLESSKSTVKPGDTFTLTATATPGGLSGVTYTFYQSSDSTVSNDDTRLTSSDNKATVTADSTPGSYYYYVVATDANSNSKTSSIVTVNVTNEGAVINNVKIRFKGTTLSSLIPYMSVDGEAATVMSRSTANPIGTHLSGAYRFVWFEATIPTVTVGQGKTLTFTTNNSKESTMDASITLDFTTCDAENVIYLAVDNLMSGTTAVDITNNNTAKTTFGSAMNMIKQSSASDPVATTLLSTMLKVTSASGKVTTKRYYLGDLDSDNKIGIKDATEIQKSIAGTSELGAEYQSLGDFNADGVVDIKDATAIQKYIAGF